MNATPQAEVSSPPKAALSVNEFCHAIGIGHSSFYEMPADQQPLTVRIGRRRLVVESPTDYLERLAGAQRKAQLAAALEAAQA
ncbi:MAG: hypothetical protein KIT73_05570 [Burkholderiales bacterium]|nr:hypothetical protein [Burkholderiales bacterium]